MNKQIWESKVAKLKKYSSFKEDFDLAKKFLDTKEQILLNHALVKEFHRRWDDLSFIEKLIKSEEKSLKFLKSLSQQTKNEITANFNDEICSKKKWIQSLISYKERQTKFSRGKRYPSSISVSFIGYLAYIYYEGTGKMPICNNIQREIYEGHFYDFLIAASPILKEIGIDLLQDETIGKYACQIIHGYKKKNGDKMVQIQPFKEIIKNISLLNDDFNIDY